jgi:glycosyltransferase involved in cell wall biosynthesis
VARQALCLDNTQIGGRQPHDVLFLGRLVEQKDPALLLHAIQTLSAQDPRWLALFAGEGPLRADLEHSAAQLGIQEHVRFLGARNDVGRLLAAADVLAMPSRFEGLPLAALEAMAMAVPVVGCDAPGVRDAVRHGWTGWLGPIGDAQQLAEGLRLAVNAKEGRSWREAARHLYARHYTARHMAERLEREYRRLAPRRTRTEPISLEAPMWPASGKRAPVAERTTGKM